MNEASINESVTWRAVHFGISQTLSTKITEFERPTYFVDEMVKGAFKSFRHEHYFQSTESGTRMTDRFDYESPLGILGQLVDLVEKVYDESSDQTKRDD